MSNVIISKEEVKKVSRLARININQQEEEKFSKDLSSILDHFKDLSKLDVSEVQKVDFRNATDNQVRQDKVKENGKEEKDRIKDQFPDREDNYLKVKAVL